VHTAVPVQHSMAKYSVGLAAYMIISRAYTWRGILPGWNMTWARMAFALGRFWNCTRLHPCSHHHHATVIVLSPVTNSMAVTVETLG